MTSRHTGSHENAAYNQQFLIMVLEETQQPQNDAGTSQNPKTNREAPHANGNGIVSIHVKGLGGPEHQDGEKVTARDKSDDQGET